MFLLLVSHWLSQYKECEYGGTKRRGEEKKAQMRRLRQAYNESVI